MVDSHVEVGKKEAMWAMPIDVVRLWSSRVIPTISLNVVSLPNNLTFCSNTF